MSETAATDAAMAEMLNGTQPGADADQPDDEPTEEREEGQEPESIDDLPEWAREEILRLRRKDAAARVKLRQATKKQTPTTGEPPSDASEQALRAAEDRGRASARLEFAIQLAGAEIKAALAGVLDEDQIVDVVDDLNLTRFVDDDGEVDEDAVKALRDKYLHIVGKRTPPPVSNGRQTRAAPQKSTADQFADALGPAFR